MEVMSAEAAGLSSNLQLAVYVPRSGRMKLAKAEAYILLGPDTLESYDLTARINRVPFALDPNVEYTLVTIKNGFTRDTRQFVFNDISGSVLRIELDPAFTMLGYTHVDYTTSFQFMMESDPGTVWVDWGDGSGETHSFTGAGYSFNFQHEYAVDGNHFITMTGDLAGVKYFYSFYGQGMLDAINFEQLINLNEVRLGLTRGPEVIDLSENLNIRKVRVPGVRELRDLILPHDNLVSLLDVSGPNDMNMPEVSGLVNNIYTNVVNHGTVNGVISVAGSWWGDPSEPLFTGPPSMAAKNKLILLRDNYGWSVAPDF